MSDALETHDMHVEGSGAINYAIVIIMFTVRCLRRLRG